MKPVLLIAPLLAACGVPFVPAGECHVGGYSVMMQAKGDCDQAGRVIPAAQFFLRTQGIATDEEMDGVKGITIWVHSTDDGFKCGFTSNEDGCSTPGLPFNTSLELDADMGALPHEWLHEILGNRGWTPWENSSHKGWGSAGATLGDDGWQDDRGYKFLWSSWYGKLKSFDRGLWHSSEAGVVILEKT